jgi:hypothetical protein
MYDDVAYTANSGDTLTATARPVNIGCVPFLYISCLFTTEIKKAILTSK